MVTKAKNTGGWLSTRRKLEGWSNGKTDVMIGLYIIGVGGVATVWLDILKRSIFCTSELSKRREILSLSLYIQDIGITRQCSTKILTHFKLRGCAQFRIFGVIKTDVCENRIVNLDWH